jgi:hypothetical protein
MLLFRSSADSRKANIKIFRLVIVRAAFGDHFRLTSSELPKSRLHPLQKKNRRKVTEKIECHSSPADRGSAATISTGVLLPL